jgi:hypothetical protein
VKLARHECPECFGTGKSECECCGAEQDCENCEATGLDPETVDLEAWMKAESELFGLSSTTWEWSENGKVLGRMNDCGRIAIRDYMKLNPAH